MARIVEILGTAGVGKSTIYKNMVSNWSNTANWIPSQFLYPQEKLKFDTLSKLLLSIEKKFTASEGNVDERILKQYGDRFLAEYPLFINACWHNIFIENNQSAGSPDLRFDKARYMFFTFQKFQFLRESKTSKTTVLDEGIVHRIANGLYRRGNLEEERDEIRNLIQLMPLPDALIHVETDVEEIAKRLHNRRKRIGSHRSLSLAELERSSLLSIERISLVLQNLENRNVPVLYINSKHDVVANSKAIIHFVEGLNKMEYVS